MNVSTVNRSVNRVVRTFTTLRTVWWSADIHEIEDSSVECGHS